MLASLIRLSAMALAAGLAAAATAHADEMVPEPICYDALVLAKIVRQVPTEYPSCGDCIVMSWPWIVELNVERILKGSAPEGVVTVLTVQHAYLRTDLGARHWWLRRNVLGAFNVLQLEGEQGPSRCSKDLPPARPFISPVAGKTLSDLRRESERANKQGTER